MAKYTATVKEVIDGDTFTTLRNNFIRLARVNAPEEGKTGYTKAKEDLKGMIDGREITYEQVGSSYGRIVAEVWHGSRSVNDAMVALGWV